MTTSAIEDVHIIIPHASPSKPWESNKQINVTKNVTTILNGSKADMKFHDTKSIFQATKSIKQNYAWPKLGCFKLKKFEKCIKLF